MPAMSITKGWMIFVKSLWQCKPWSAGDAAEWMYRLNVTARHVGRHMITDQIYKAKDAFIQYLYQHGYSTEVKMHKMSRECWTCYGTGEHWSGGQCFKCNGSGVYSVTYLYAFRFRVDGKRYAWHQLKRLVDYPVELSISDKDAAEEFVKEEKDDSPLSLYEAWFGVCILWWWLFFHGVKVDLFLFRATRVNLSVKLNSIKSRFTKDEIPF